jgi:integrase
MRPKIEFCRLQIRDLGVWNGQHQIDVRKGKRRVARGITIDLELAAMLRKHRLRNRKGARQTDPVFVDARGNALSYKALHGRLKKLGEKAGVGRLNPYRLRHTFGTILYKDRKDVFYVAKQMGHKKIETTKIYVHTSETDESEQMEALRRHIKEAEKVRK